ncbi:hypothetical protein OAD61_00525 [bacterium]|nr:hypothetical protein [bacterium]
MEIKKGELIIKEARLLNDGKLDRKIEINQKLAIFLKQTDIELNTEELNTDTGQIEPIDIKINL